MRVAGEIAVESTSITQSDDSWSTEVFFRRRLADSLGPGNRCAGGQHRGNILKLNWMNIFFWGTDPKLEVPGLDAG